MSGRVTFVVKVGRMLSQNRSPGSVQLSKRKLNASSRLLSITKPTPTSSLTIAYSKQPKMIQMTLLCKTEYYCE